LEHKFDWALIDF